MVDNKKIVLQRDERIGIDGGPNGGPVRLAGRQALIRERSGYPDAVKKRTNRQKR